MRNLIRTVALILLNTAVAFFVIELGVRFLAPSTISTNYLVGGPLGLEDPVLGHRNRPDTVARVKAPEYDVEYFVDSNGFRGMRDADPMVLNSDAVTILLLGDSFTFGAANSVDDIWPTFLSQKFKEDGRPVNIINAGVEGYNTAQQALYLEELYSKYQPDIVLTMFLPNDLFANEPIQTVDGIDVAVTDARAVVRAGAGKRSSLHSVAFLKRMMMRNDGLYTSLYALTPRREFFQTPPSELFLSKLNATKSILERMGKFCSENDTDLVVISVPQLFQVLYEASNDGPGDLDASIPDDVLAPLAEGWDIQWVSVLDTLVQVYTSSNEDLYHRYDGHLNARGNKVVAEAIHETLLPLLDR